MKLFSNVIMFLVFTLFASVGLESELGISPVATFSGSIVMAVVYSAITPFLPSGIAVMALQADIWTGEILKHFRHENQFLGRVPSQDEKVKFNAIHLIDLGVDPEVLINNTTYPIAVTGRDDADIVITLDKLETTNTEVTHDELHALPYDKQGSVVTQHREVLQQVAAEKSAHSLCPTLASGNTPLVMTTGASNGETYARKRMTINDVIKAKKTLDDLKIPREGRELVLSNDHVQDLLLTSQVFAKQYHDIVSGKVNNVYGFIISEFISNPLFSNTTGEKKAFGAALAPTTDLSTSFFYYNRRTTQAKGTVDMFYRDAKTDPENRKNVVGFKIYHLCLPKKDVGFGAIVSSVV